MILENGYDKKTDRYYCEPCFEATNKVLLANLDAEMEEIFGTSQEFLGQDVWVSEYSEEEIEEDTPNYDED